MAVTSYITMDGMLMGEMTDGVMRNYGTDALGSVVETVLNGMEENTYQYKPYGGLLAKTGVASDPNFLWNGCSGYRTTGAGSADVYVRRRHFGFSTTRWTSVDALWPRERAFAYVQGSPIIRRDPSGLGDGELGTLSSPMCVDINPQEQCGKSHCKGTWGSCAAFGSDATNKKQCSDPKNAYKNCKAILNEINGIDGTLGGGSDDTASDSLWTSCTYCCTNDNSNFKTVCCSTAPKPNPCVMFCLSVGHEADGHGHQQCDKNAPPGGPGPERDALVCERDCLMEGWNNLNCSQFKDLTLPRPRPPGLYAHQICNVDRGKYF